MNTKKIIGTIIGVIAFAALIAGATYAWLSTQVNVTNGTYNAKTMNFLVNYTKGTNVTALSPIATPTTTNTTKLTVKAGLAAGSAPGKMTIYLNTTSNSNKLITDKVIKYGYCISTNDTCTTITGIGTVNATGRTAIITNTILSSTINNYNIYLWLDGEEINDSHVGLSYAGYIEAIATQNE